MPIDLSKVRTIRPRVYVPIIVLIVGVLFLSRCERPTHDQAKLRAIKAEALMLMKGRPIHTEFDILKNELPPAIESLKPEFVMIDESGIDIMTKSYFDGGWGYYIPRDKSILVEPKDRFSDLGNGVYWHHPY